MDMTNLRTYVATSERAWSRSDERENTFHLNMDLQVGDTFTFDGLTWHVDEVVKEGK